jgi:Spy/CpxP family protein refolding chaperone
MFDHLLQRRPNPRLAFAAAATVLALAFAGAAVAQPGGVPGDSHHAMMSAGGGDGFLGHAIGRAQAKLNLNTSQKLMFDNALAQAKAAHESGRALHQKVKDSLTAELAKTEPDLAAVAAVSDGVQQQGIALRHQVRDAWLQLYATFTPDQKAVVREMLQNHLAHMESFRQKLKERLSGAG